MSEYYDGREWCVEDARGASIDDLQAMREAGFGIEATTTELFTVGSNKPEPVTRFSVTAPVNLYPRPPTEEMAHKLYLAGEATLEEFEQMLHTALSIDGGELV